MSFYRNKKILVTGGTGMIGRFLVKRLVDEGASVRIASLDHADLCPDGATFLRTDLMQPTNCLEACKDREIVFHVAGIKGSPAMTRSKPASFFVPTILFNTNMMEAARASGCKRYLFTSSVGVYEPAEVFHEDDVWTSFPSPNDRFAGWAKRMGELQADAYAIEHDWEAISIVRPANVYGPFDNFDPDNAMVIPSLIHRALSGENPLTVWGDGSSVRDFIHADDVARGMMFAVEHGIYKPINLGSGSGVSIQDLVEIIVSAINPRPQVVWDTSKPSGDKLRILDMSRAQSYGFEPKMSLEEGIHATIAWYRDHKEKANKRYNVFTSGHTAFNSDHPS